MGKNKYNMGVHLSIAGGLYKSIERANHLGIDTLQIFLKNNNRWVSKDYTEEDILKFKESISGKDFKLFAHTAYLINLAAEPGQTYDKSIDALTDELNRAGLVNIPYLVLHPGSHKENSLQWGIERVAESLDIVFEKSANKDTIILLENSAGQGTNIGYELIQLQQIMDLSKNKDRLAICYDTCHGFAAGYDFRSEELLEKLVLEIESTIGFEKIKLIHLNDSKHDAGTRKDRHDHIGEGFIGMEGFKLFLNHKKFKDIPMVMETPKDKSDEFKCDLMNLDTVDNLIN